MNWQTEITSTISKFDSFASSTNLLYEAYNRVSKSHIDLARSFQDARIKHKKDKEEFEKRIHELNKQVADLKDSLNVARVMLDDEKKKTRRAMRERDHYEHKLNILGEILKNDNGIKEDTKVKLSLIADRPEYENEHLETIEEGDNTASLMADLSCTREYDDSVDFLDAGPRAGKRHSMKDTPLKSKRRKSSRVELGNADNIEKVIATTTVTMEHNGPISATSVVETIPTCSSKTQIAIMGSGESSDTDANEIFSPRAEALPYSPFGKNGLNTRPHRFMVKQMIKGENCHVCDQRIKFSATGAKCKECKSVCHSWCKDSVPLPCIPATKTPSKNGTGTIADYAPSRPPLIPALVIHCIKEIESRGLTEVGLYRIPGSDKEVKALKDRFIKGKGIPNLAPIRDIHAICGCLKEFLRSLKEPLITTVRWRDFVKTAEIDDNEERRSALFQIVSDLPRPNRDTLAYIVLHLQKVAESPECKMPISNLAKMFGTTVVGYSRTEPENLFAETNNGHNVMNELLSIPAEYWESFLKEKDSVANENQMPKTPSSNSLLNFFHTPSHSKPDYVFRRKKKYFDNK